MMTMKPSLLCLAAAAALAGCTSLPAKFAEPSAVREQTREVAQQRATTQVNVAPRERVVESTETFIPVTPRKVSEHGWLRAMRVSLQTGSTSLSMAEVMRLLSRQGVNITSEIPLERYNYGGFSLNDTDAETALRMVLGSAGLDYQADSARKLVVVKPMGSRTWYLNMGNRRVSYIAGSGGSGGGSSGPATGGSASSGSASGGSNSSTPFAQSSGVQASASGTSGVTAQDDFWASLKTELDSRMKILVPDTSRSSAAAPAAPAAQLAPLPTVVGKPVDPAMPPSPGAGLAIPPIPSAMPAPAATSASLEAGTMAYTSRTIGTFSLNPETGAVTVQAPHWIQHDLDAYFKRVQEMYNTDITFQGELILLSTENSNSEGLDIGAFGKFARGRYGLNYQNNALGGVTVSFPNANAIGAISAGAQAVAGPLLGVTAGIDGLQLFNAYLSNLGRVNTLQRPVLTTTSGVPADFRRTITRYFNSVSQQAASGGSGSAAVGTQNQLIAQDFGTILRVNPRYDIATGLIRAQIELVQTTQAGTQTVTQALTSGNSVQKVDSQLPIVSKIIYTGEALLRDGDLVVMGGQTEDSENASREGITGLMDNAQVGGAFGKTVKKSERNVFYFALRVSVAKR